MDKDSDKAIYILNNNFTTSFKATASVRYNVAFENSNVLTSIEKLKQLHHNVKNNLINIDEDGNPKHVGYPINLNDVEIIIETLDRLVDHYQTINKLSAIPSKLKLYELETNIRQSESDNEVIKEVREVREIFKPTITDKLTPKQKRVKKSKAIVNKLIKKD